MVMVIVIANEIPTNENISKQWKMREPDIDSMFPSFSVRMKDKRGHSNLELSCVCWLVGWYVCLA